MPVGINTLVVAHAYDLDLAIAASAGVVDGDRRGSRARLRGDLMHSVTNGCHAAELTVIVRVVVYRSRAARPCSRGP